MEFREVGNWTIHDFLCHLASQRMVSKLWIPAKFIARKEVLKYYFLKLRDKRGGERTQESKVKEQMNQ